MSVDWILHAATKVTWLRWEWKWFKKCINFNFNVSGRTICNLVIYVTGSIFRTLVMGSGWDGRDRQTGNFRWVWWCQLSQPDHLALINGTRYFKNCDFGCRSNNIYCDLVGPFLMSVFDQCYLGYESNRLCLDNSVGSEVSPDLHPCINVDVLRHVSIFTSLSDFWKVHYSPTSLHW